MNPEWKEKWITALRSGEYQQGKGSLRNSYNQFCCLGVFCDIYIKKNPDRAKWEDNTNTFIIDDLRYGVYLAPIFKEIAGFSENEFYDCNVALMVMNDNGMTFKEIADIIEKEF
jgi:hypothetical protein